MADIEGFAVLQRRLKALEGTLQGKLIRGAAVDALLPAMQAARRAIPVGAPPYDDEGTPKDPYPVRSYTGRLRVPSFARRNVARKSTIFTNGNGVNAMLGVKPEAFYAIAFHEFGTSQIPARPWLEPAFRQQRSAMEARFRTRLRQRLDKAARR